MAGKITQRSGEKEKNRNGAGPYRAPVCSAGFSPSKKDLKDLRDIKDLKDIRDKKDSRALCRVYLYCLIRFFCLVSSFLTLSADGRSSGIVPPSSAFHN